MSQSANSSFKPPQIRRCAACQKVGHNKSTCPVFLASFKKKSKSIYKTKATFSNKKEKKSSTTKPTPAPLNFFVHHVYHPPTESPHRVDLKKQHYDIWDEIQTVAPETSSTYFQSHQTMPKEMKKSLAISPPQLHIPAEIEEIPLQKNKIIPFLNRSSSTKKNSFFTSFFIKRKEKKSLEVKNKIKNKINFSSIYSSIQKGKKYFSQFTFNTRHPSAIFENMFASKKMAVALVVIIVLVAISGPFQAYAESIRTTKNIVAEKSTEGFMALQDSTSALLSANIPLAEESSVRALNNFGSALQTLEEKHRLLQKIASTIPVVKNEVVSRQNIIKAGQKITLGNTYVLKGLEESKNSVDENMINRFSLLITHLRAAIPNYEDAVNALETVDPETLPLKYQTSFKEYKQLFNSLVHDFKNLAELGDSLEEIFGGEGLRRYILVFQNSDELRATGGFMGSFAEIDVKDGKIEKITVPPGGTYDVQGQLSEFVEPPTPLLLANKRWEFQDANWFPDFSKSAEKILWFYRHTGRGSVDGVIAINSSVLTRLLALMGPLTHEERNLTLTDQNVLTTLQTIVEEGPEKKINKPKQILSELAPEFIDYFKKLNTTELLPVLVDLKQALDQKEIQAYFTDQTIQKHVASFGWSGTLSDVSQNQDYLLVINSNIQGQKSDAKIKQKITHQAVVQQDGSIINNVVITRQHTGILGEKFYGVPNIDFIRVYVPEGSELLSAEGFTWPEEKAFKAPENWAKKDKDLQTIEKNISFDSKSGTRIATEFGKTSFGNWVVTEPGTTSQIHFSYRLPFSISPSTKENASWFSKASPALYPYHLIVQRQSGSESTFESQIIVPENWKPVSEEGPQIELAKNGARILEQDLKQDSSWSFAAEKNSPSLTGGF